MGLTVKKLVDARLFKPLDSLGAQSRAYSTSLPIEFLHFGEPIHSKNRIGF